MALHYRFTLILLTLLVVALQHELVNAQWGYGGYGGGWGYRPWGYRRWGYGGYGGYGGFGGPFFGPPLFGLVIGKK